MIFWFYPSERVVHCFELSKMSIFSLSMTYSTIFLFWFWVPLESCLGLKCTEEDNSLLPQIKQLKDHKKMYISTYSGIAIKHTIFVIVCYNIRFLFVYITLQNQIYVTIEIAEFCFNYIWFRIFPSLLNGRLQALQHSVGGNHGNSGYIIIIININVRLKNSIYFFAISNQ